jgi:hypothetical protein
LVIARWSNEREQREQLHHEREETELIVSNLIGAKISLFKAGKNLADTTRITEFNGEHLWLRRGSYFLRAEHGRKFFFVPVPIFGYRSGPVDDDRNHDDTAGLRVARGGSWYSASIAILYIPYRDAFQPEHSTQDIGFRIAAKLLP